MITMLANIAYRAINCVSPATLPPIWFDEGNTGVLASRSCIVFSSSSVCSWLERRFQRPLVVAGVAAELVLRDCAARTPRPVSFSSSSSFWTISRSGA